MKIINEIKRIVEFEMKLPFIYASYYNINEKIGRSDLPCIALVREQRGALDFNKVSADLLLFFVDKTDKSRTDFELSEKIAEQKSTAIDFLRACAKSDVFYIENASNYEDLYDEFDIITAGISISISVKELVGDVKCFNND